MRTKSIILEDWQDIWAKEKCMSLSKWIRQKINEEMELERRDLEKKEGENKNENRLQGKDIRPDRGGNKDAEAKVEESKGISQTVG